MGRRELGGTFSDFWQKMGADLKQDKTGENCGEAGSPKAPAHEGGGVLGGSIAVREMVSEVR